jgi:hypothetical protein
MMLTHLWQAMEQIPDHQIIEKAMAVLAIIFKVG